MHAFPDAFFSWPFKAMPDGNALRSSLHRICGWLFVVFFTGHAAALLLGRTGRAHARALWFSWDDVKDFSAQLFLNLGRRQAGPPRRRWNYAEKAEYPMNPSWLIGTRAAHGAHGTDPVQAPTAPAAAGEPPSTAT